MKARCLFKLSPCGKIYSSRFDVDKGLIDCLTEDIFKCILRPEIYNTRPPFDESHWLCYSMERYMYENLDVFLTIDVPGSCFYAFKNNGNIYLVSRDLKEKRIGFLEKGWYDLWKVIGYMPTKVCQFAARPYISELSYCLKTKSILLPTGEFENTWFHLDCIESLLEPSDVFLGYKDCVSENAYAVVYKENPMLMFVENNGLVLKEIGRKEVM